MKKFLAAGMLVVALGSACTPTTSGSNENDAAICAKLQSHIETTDYTNIDDMAALGLSGIVAGTLLEGNPELKAEADEFKAELLATGDIGPAAKVEAYGTALVTYCNSL